MSAPNIRASNLLGKAALDTGTIGTSGLKRAGGIVIDEPLLALRGAQGRRILGEMLLDPVISGFVYAVEKAVGSLDWRFDPGDDSPEAVEAAQFAEECLEDMSLSWDSTVGEILTMLGYGWSLLEIIYKRRRGENLTGSPLATSKYDDGRIGWAVWSPRAQETLLQWDFADDDTLNAMVQLDPYAGHGAVHIPMSKSLLFRTTSRRLNPEGVPLVRGAYRPWRFKQRLEEIEAIGVERDLAGYPVAYAPWEWMTSTADPDQVAALAELKSIVTSIRRNESEGVVLPAMFDEHGNRVVELSLLSTGSSRAFDTDKIITRYDQRIAMSVLADWMLLGHDGTGSYSLGVTKMTQWTTSLEAVARAIAEVVNTDALPRLLRLNGITAPTPKLAYGDVTVRNLEEIADYIQKLVGAGVITPDDNLEAYARELADLPPGENEHAHVDAAEEAAEARERMAAQLAQQSAEPEAGAEAPDGAAPEPGAEPADGPAAEPDPDAAAEETDETDEDEPEAPAPPPRRRARRS